MDIETWEGVQSLLDNYVAIRDEDLMVLLYASDSAEPAAWVTAALEQRGMPVRRVWMNPLQDEEFAARLASAMPQPDEFSGRIIVLSLERDTMSHQKTIGLALAPFDKERRVLIRTISACPSLFSSALRPSPAELSARNAAVLERCFAATRLRIKSAGGTDLRIKLDNQKFRWISNRGSARPGGFLILPAGEVATFPAEVEGVLVADFAYNANIFTEIDARLHSHPVTVWIENQRAVRWHCDDAVFGWFLDDCFERFGAHRVGELGLGTNFAIDEGVSLNSHINERRPGVHLGFGQHNQKRGIVDYTCELHLDLITKGALIWFDDDPVPMDLENVVPSTNAHPDHTRDEDAFSLEETDLLDVDDCCGLLTCDGLKLAKTQQELAEMI